MLVDVSAEADLRTELFGTVYDCADRDGAGGQPAEGLSSGGEAAVARAAHAKGTWQFLHGHHPDRTGGGSGRMLRFWYQLMNSRWEITGKWAEAAQRAVSAVLVLTVDQRLDGTPRRWSDSAHGLCDLRRPPILLRKPMFTGIADEGVGLSRAAMTWQIVAAVADMSGMKPGAEGHRRYRARMRSCVRVGRGRHHRLQSRRAGAGGGRGTIEALPEVVEGVVGAASRYWWMGGSAAVRIFSRRWRWRARRGIRRRPRVGTGGCSDSRA